MPIQLEALSFVRSKVHNVYVNLKEEKRKTTETTKNQRSRDASECMDYFSLLSSSISHIVDSSIALGLQLKKKFSLTRCQLIERARRLGKRKND